MPADAAKLIGEQLHQRRQDVGRKEGLGLLSRSPSRCSARRNGAGAVITALNIAYEEKEKRNFVVAQPARAGDQRRGGGVALAADRDGRARPPRKFSARPPGIVARRVRQVRLLLLAGRRRGAAATPLSLRSAPVARALVVADAGVGWSRGDLAADDAGVRLLCRQFRQLQRDLRLARRDRGDADLAVFVEPTSCCSAPSSIRSWSGRPARTRRSAHRVHPARAARRWRTTGSPRRCPSARRWYRPIR